MWFEIYRSGKLVIRGNDIINDSLDWDIELMSVPSLSFDLPIYYKEYINGREEIKIFVNDKCFWGIITGVDIDKDGEKLGIDVTHVVHEWTYRQISVNNAIKDKKIQFVFKSHADHVREQNGVSICASNFSCKPTDTNFKTLAKVQAWKKNGEVLYPDPELESKIKILRKNQREFDDRINDLFQYPTRGNVDYSRRPLIPGYKMQEFYPEVNPNDWVTTYSFGVTIGQYPNLYTVEFTPIREDGEIYSQPEMNSYIYDHIRTSGGISSILSSDYDKLVIHVESGDYDPSFWNPWYNKYDELKEDELQVRLQIMDLEDQSAVSYKLFTRKEKEGDEEGYTYTEINNLPSLSKKDETKEVYVRFYVKSEPGLYVQVQCTVTNDPEYDNGEVDITDASVFDQLDDIYGDMNFAYPGWNIDYQDGSEDSLIDYVYSRQNKLDALTQTMELTDDLFWRVGFTNEKKIEIGKFGKKKEWVISKRDTKGYNISLIEDPQIKYDFSKVVNVATVYSEKSAGGMNSLTLREVYDRPSLQKSGFPVVILRANVNNERSYKKYITQFPALAPNNELEYAIIDEESVALEDGHLIEGTFAFNDITAFQEKEDDEGNTIEVTDKDRIDAAKSAYTAAIRKLKNSRRSYKIQIVTEQLPVDINVGDKVRFVYDNSLYEMDECSDYLRYILDYDDWFYVTRISYSIDSNEAEINELTLEKYLKIDRETKESV